MEQHSWRHRSPPPFHPHGKSICPTCSISHFPFCPPPPPFPHDPRLRFPSQPEQFFPMPPPLPPYNPFMDHYVSRPCQDGYAKPSFSPDLYGHLNPSFDYPMSMVGAKRMRVDQVSVPPGPLLNSSVLAEDERRLKLIHDHGGATRISDSFRVGRREDDLHDPCYSSLDGKGALYSQSNFYPHKYGEEHLGRGQRHVRGDTELGESLNDQIDNTLDQRYRHGYAGASAGCYIKAEQARQSPGDMGPNPDTRELYNPDWQKVSGAVRPYDEQRNSFAPNSLEFNNHYSQSYAMQSHPIELKPTHFGGSSNSRGMHMGPNKGPRVLSGHHPPPPLPLESPLHPSSKPLVAPSSLGTTSSLFPIHVGSANKANLHAPSGLATEELHVSRQSSVRTYPGDDEKPQLKQMATNKPLIVDARHILKHPHRANRPDHFVIILRGLPGSGKSYLAKMVRDIEVENGGSAPRIHSMDDYFMTEVEKVEECESSKSSSSVKVKKLIKKKVMEYCYEPEMEEAYRSSMLKAFKKTLDERAFSFIIVDDRNLRVADFAQFWATAKRSGYEVYLLEAAYKDPAGCAARNVHGLTQDDILKMAGQWEEAPSQYLRLDVKSLLHGDDLEESTIHEVDMDMDDGDSAVLCGLEERSFGRPVIDSHVTSEGYHRGNTEVPTEVEEVKELGKSKWSNDLDVDGGHSPGKMKGNSTAPSKLLQPYRKEGKSVHWSDQASNTGFSIGAAKKPIFSSLIIGPGAGYNLKSNPLPEEESMTLNQGVESKKQRTFQDQLRAERESFKAVFDKRRQRISGLYVDDE